MDIALSALVALLRALDYRARFRRRGWTEVLVSREDERWLGRGVDQRDALEDALSKMLPSQLARELMVRALAVRSAEPEPRLDIERKLELDLEALEGPARGVVDAPRGEIDEVATSEHPAALQPTLGKPSTPSLSMVPARLDAAARPVDTQPSEARTPASAAPARSKPELLEELVALEEQIEHFLPGLPSVAPTRQRLRLTEWIASARQLQEEALGHANVDKRVARLAARLGAAGKIGWPGGVQALRLDCSPAEADFPTGQEPDQPSSSWAGVAAHARARLDAILAAATQRKEDEEGWRDSLGLEPAPPDGAARMARIQSELVRLTGPLETSFQALRKEKLEEPPRPTAIQVRELQELVEGFARELRWLRGGEHEAWGACMGRLRWLADRHGREMPQGLAPLLDPEHAPRRNWAVECGYDPGKQRQKKQKSRLLKSLSTTPKGRELATWLQQALGLGDLLANPRLLEVIAARSPDFLALGPELAGLGVDLGRSPRARWKKLHAELLLASAAPGAVAKVGRGEPEQSLFGEGEAEEAGQAEEPEEAPSAWPPTLLAKVKGLRVLWVGNRNDQQLRARLQQEFAFDSIEMVQLNPKRLDSAAERLRREGVDLVLACTGFISHAAEGKLRKAAGSEVRFVRVEKGRVGAVGRNLARALNVKLT